MKKLNDVKAKIREFGISAVLSLGTEKLAQVETDKGLLTYADELKEGAQVFLVDENNESVTAPDGIYTVSETGAVIEVKDGVIISITENATTTSEEMDEETSAALATSILELKERMTQIEATLLKIQEALKMPIEGADPIVKNNGMPDVYAKMNAIINSKKK
jgi:hypothetical protein